MKDTRPGELLWLEWPGDPVGDAPDGAYLLYTEGHVDVENEVVLRALASALQREGIVSSLYEGFNAAAGAVVSFGWSGYLSDDPVPVECDESGTVYGGEEVDPPPTPSTWVWVTV